MPDDGELLRRFAEEGAQEAFEALVRRRINFVYSVALRRVGGDAHEAEDVTQAVFSKLAQKAAALSRHPMLMGWLFTSTRFAAIQAARSKARRQRREERAAEQLVEGPEPSWEALRPILDRTLDELAARDRQAVLLRYFDDQSFAEIGRQLALSEDAARMRVQRALERLRGRLEREGMKSSVAALAALLAEHSVSAAPARLVAQVAVTATVATSGHVASSLFVLMSTSKTVGIAAGALLLATLGTAVWEYQAKREADAALARATQAESALAVRVRQLDADDQAALRAEASARAQLAAAARTAQSAQSARQAGAADAAAAREKALAAGRAFLNAHPEVEQALIARSRARSQARFGDLYAQLGLSPDQIRRFQDIMMQAEGFGANAGMMFQLGPSSANPRQVRAQMHDFLGDAGYQQFEQYMRQMDLHQAAATLAGQLYYTDTPLTQAQAEQWKEAYIAATSGPQAGRVSAADTARSVLLPAQLAALDGLRAQEDLSRMSMPAGAGK